MQLDLPRRRRNLVSLTPLIDVVFILLIFFMLASSFQRWRALDLSVPGDGAAVAAEQTAIGIRLREDGSILLEGAPVALEPLGRQVLAELTADPDRAVAVQTEPGVPLQRIVEVMDRLAAVGARNVTLVE